MNISSGSLELAVGAGPKIIGTLTGSGSGINLNGNTLSIPDGTFSGPISGGGQITKVSAGTLSLSGVSTYSGGTSILLGTLIVGADNTLGTGGIILSGGTLQPSTSFVTSKSVSITANSGLHLPSGVDLEINGNITGGGNLLKSGGGKLTLSSGTNTYTGMTTLTGGRLALNNSSCGDVTMSTGTFLEGSGIVSGDLFNAGTVSPGFSIGTIAVTGNYEQTLDGTYAVEIHPDGSSDLLDVTAVATLAGTLLLEPTPAVYDAGTTYTVLSASSIVNDFTQFLETHPLDFTYDNTGTQILITVLFSEAILPVDIDSLSGNAGAFAEYLFCSDGRFLPSSPDLREVINDLALLSPAAFKTELALLTPQQFRALPLTGLQNSMRTANAMLSRLSSHDFNWVERCRAQQGKDQDPNALPHDVWFQPIGYFYKQNERQDEFGFNVRTYGFSTGTSLVFWDHMVVGVGGNYLYSNLHFAKNSGKAKLDTVSVGPTIGYLTKNWFVNLLLLGGRTFYDVDRTIEFTGVKRTAHNDHKSWDAQATLSSGMRFKVPNAIQENFYLQPAANLSVISIFESGYQESGADSLNLSVQSKTSAFFKSQIDLRMIKDLHVKTVCLSPSLRVGWLKYVPLTNGDYVARLYGQDTCQSDFLTETFDKSTDQLVLGAELLTSPHDHLSFELAYEANIGDHYFVQEGTFRLQWDF